jgi:predicted site-specific integrase-resolvase
MVIDTAPAVTGTQLGYARVSTTHQSLDQQMDALTGVGVDATRVYTDKLSGTSTRQERPGLAALLDYARQGDAIVVVGIDRLGRNAAEVYDDHPRSWGAGDRPAITAGRHRHFKCLGPHGCRRSRQPR